MRLLFAGLGWLFAGAASAAPLAAEGRFEIVYCYGGDVKVIEHSKDVMGGAVSSSGPVRSMTQGGVLDRSASSCHSAFTVVQGKLNEYGYCEVVDTDGDRMFFAFTSDSQGGKWTGYPGTGKYQSYLWQADWERMGPFPSVVPGTVQGCNRSWGTYKLFKATEFQAK
ncbi:MAG: hypothetical protein EXR36_05380 [Betaproteobacteria bacterium]|nr:hypothetical protein [Betaproteobacteria bacterium]